MIKPKQNDAGTIQVKLENYSCEIKIDNMTPTEIAVAITALIGNVVEDFPDMRIPLISAIMTTI